MGYRKPISIEKLLQWAYRDELPKQAVGGLTGWERLIYLGTEVDETTRGGFEVRLPVALGPPHPDALKVDYFVRSIENVRCDWWRERHHLLGSLLPYASGQEPRSKVVGRSPVVELHPSTARSGRALMSARVRRTAAPEIVARDFSLAEHVILHARLGTRPSWEMPARLAPVLSGNNKPSMIGRMVRKGVYTTGSYSPLRLTPSAAEIAAARWEYAVWHWALVDLARVVCGLADFAPQPPSAPAAPWITGAPPTPRILKTITSVHAPLTTVRISA